MRKKTLSVLVGCMIFLGGIGCSKHEGKLGLNINPEPINPVIEKEEAREVEKPKVPEKEDLPKPTRLPCPTRWHDGKNLTPLQKAENELFRCHAWAEHLQMVINRNQNSGNLCRVEGSKKDLEIALKDIRKAEDRVLELRSQANKTKSKP